MIYYLIDDTNFIYMRNPEIIIYMPARNEGKYIAQTIKSLRNQTFSDYKVVISDNCSTDNTVSEIENACSMDSRFALIKQTECLTAYDNFQFGRKFFTEKYHMFAGAHDLFHVNYLEKIFYNLKVNPNAVVSSSKCFHFKDSGEFFSIPSLDLNTNGISPLERVIIYLQGTYYNSMFYGLYRTDLISKIIPPPVIACDHLEMAYHLINGDAITCDDSLIYFRYPNNVGDKKRQINSLGTEDGLKGWKDLMHQLKLLMVNNFQGLQLHYGMEMVKSIFLTRYLYLLNQLDIEFLDAKLIADSILRVDARHT